MELKFKAKRLDNGEWLEFDFIDIAGTYASGRVEILTKDCTETITVLLDTICQYTGLNDTEGNRIFEGDELEHWIDGFKYAFFARWDSEDACYDGDCSAWRWRDLKLTGHNIHDRG